MSNLFTTKLIYILLTWKDKPEYLKEYSFFNMSGEQKNSNFFWTEKEEKILFILNKWCKKALFQTPKEIINIFYLEIIYIWGQSIQELDIVWVRSCRR